jgi:hypothetical protein
MRTVPDETALREALDILSGLGARPGPRPRSPAGAGRPYRLCQEKFPKLRGRSTANLSRPFPPATSYSAGYLRRPTPFHKAWMSHSCS